MSVKLKLLLILLLSILITGAAGLLLSQQPDKSPTQISKNPQQPLALSSPVSASSNTLEPERIGYKTIPLENLQLALQGTDPAALATELVEDTQRIEPNLSHQQVEVTYPSQNQILVTITQTTVPTQPNQKGNLKQVASENTPKSSKKKPLVAKRQKYQVELTSLGSTVLVNSPPMWQIVWAGYQE
jgi:hypothetical protein